VLADVWSMGSSDYLSSHAEAEQGDREHDDNPPLYTAFATFVSFVIVGFVPLVPFITVLFVPSFAAYAAWTSIAANDHVCNSGICFGSCQWGRSCCIFIADT